MSLKYLASFVFATSLLTGVAHAGTGSEGYFTVYNNTDENTVVGFYTNDGSGWSENWLADQIAPGSALEAEFIANTGNCDQTLSVGWLSSDGGEVIDEPINIDICDASNIYLDDNEIYYD